jgi:hypothetical protein
VALESEPPVDEREGPEQPWTRDTVAAAAAERVRQVVAEAEEHAAEIRHEAEQYAEERRRQADLEADRQLREASRGADELVVERVRRITELTDAIVDRASRIIGALDHADQVKRRFDLLAQTLGEAAERMAREISQGVEPGPPRGPGLRSAGPAAQPGEAPAPQEPPGPTSPESGPPAARAVPRLDSVRRHRAAG